MIYPRIMVSNQNEEFIRLQRVKSVQPLENYKIWNLFNNLRLWQKSITNTFETILFFKDDVSPILKELKVLLDIQCTII